jgi:hypothetical protein
MKQTIKKIQEDLETDPYVSLKGVDSKPVINVTQISPGETIAFSYKGNTYNAIIVSTKRGNKNGFFVSTRNNLLVSAIKLNFNLTSNTMFLSQLYNKAKKANYKKLSSNNKSRRTWLTKWFAFAKGSQREMLISGLMGRRNFRTFIFKDMSEIIKLELGV